MLFCFSLKLNKETGSPILMLSVSDKDSSRNGAPFEFRILSGNEDNGFSLDQNGELRSNRVFGPDATREYTLEIQANTSPKEQLSNNEQFTFKNSHFIDIRFNLGIVLI